MNKGRGKATMFEKPFRCHFSIAFENTLQAFWLIIVGLFAFITNVLDDFMKSGMVTDKVLLIGLAFISIFLLVFLFNVWLWQRTYIQIKDSSVFVERRTIFRKTSVINIKSISTVNLQQSIVEKILNTYKIKLDTNTLSTANKNDLKIILKKDTALAFKDAINSYKTGTAAPEKAIDEIENNYDIAYTFGQVVKHSLLSLPVYSLVMAIGTVIGFVLAFRGDTIAQALVAQGAGLFFAFILFIVPAIWSMFYNFIRLYNFKAKRVDDKIVICYGLLTYKRFIIPVQKINAITVNQPLFARFTHNYAVELVNVGMGTSEDKAAANLLLMCSKNNIKEKLNILLPEFPIDFPEQKQAKKSLIPLGIKYILITALFAAPAFYFFWWAGLIVIIFATLSFYLNFITKSIGLKDDMLQITKGIFMKKTVIMHYGKIQKMSVHQSRISQKLGLAKSKIYILASSVNVMHHTGYFPKTEFDIIADKTVENYSFV